MACNKPPERDHPFHGTPVACYYPTGHEGDCSWALEPSIERRAIDRLLQTFPNRDIEWIGPPGPLHFRYTPEDLPSPWLILKFRHCRELAIWRRNGETFEHDEHGAVLEEPLLPALEDV